MKKSLLKLCLLACIALFSIACSNSVKLTGNEFLIEGKISGVEDGIVIGLVRWEGNSGSLIAFDTLKDGRFMLKAEAISNPERMTISPQGDGFPSLIMSVWVAPRAKIKINGIGKLHLLWEVKSSVPSQKEENRYTNQNRDIIAELAHISAERNDMIRMIMAASSREESLPYRNIVDSLDVINDSLSIIKNYADINIMEKTDVSPVWLYKMYVIASYLGIPKFKEFREKAEKLYNKMSEDDKTTLLGYYITASIFPPDVVEIGDDFADTDLLDVDGNTKRLADYLGKYLLLDFWSRGCGPCIMALPEMKEISETYSDKLTIISISLDADAAWKESMAEHDMPWVNIRDPKSFGGLAATYGVSGIPNYVMISPEGKIIDKWMGFGTGFLKRKVSENIGL
jgi:thiol-disulfide isomerase/thioredoxin